ncbi:hypothetical protein AJ80_05482 [Polytolypa hystricis UAMH7299]|uniref:DUF4048 domain-containing protein n=1 Tax=Polytolypa hystricis (strain UAMH7299) TaxID=1447883 RepID=A0A2B7Y4K6_POLH7|nr:hypothetical protein AJ80_05482 [Polytolypa hystricis UAMH7299]
MGDPSGIPPRDEEPAIEMPPPVVFDNPQQLKRASLPLRPNVAARHAKRMTLNFPININIPQPSNPPTPAEQSEQSSPSAGTMSPRPQVSALNSPSHPSSTNLGLIDTQPESVGFLTALAAQERKVLELREELHRAEAELATLKRQWAMGERGRKRTEILHHAEALKPLKEPPLTILDGPDHSEPPDVKPHLAQAKLSRELERRNSLRRSACPSPLGDTPGGTISSKRRTVFESSRHTRTLSLLSPASLGEFKTPFPQPDDVRNSNSMRPARSPRSATLPSSQTGPPTAASPAVATAEQKAQWRKTLPPIAQDISTDVLVQTGKQMASDFREGLWTFIEDIRQATVGEEGISGTESRSSQPSQSTSRAGRRSGVGVDVGRERSTDSTARTGRPTASKRLTSTISTTSSGKTSKPGNDQETSFWSEFGIDTADQAVNPPKTAARSTTKTTAATQNGQKGVELANPLDEDDNWDVWDTPQPVKHTPSSSSSTFPSQRDHSTSTIASSPRTSASFTDLDSIQPEHVPGSNKHDGIPWPSLSKLTPSNLTKTASNLMAEWERSLSPAQDRAHDHADSAPSKVGKHD